MQEYYRVFSKNYHSNSQLARAVTEQWCKENSYCPFCSADVLVPYPNNKKVADFYCEDCGQEFQLKAQRGKIGYHIADGEYHTMLQAIVEGSVPHFLIMAYSADWASVSEFVLIHRKFVLRENIIKRKPLSIHARRAGWTGCTIDLRQTTDEAKIKMIYHAKVEDAAIVRSKSAKLDEISRGDLSNRSWLNDVLLVISRLSGVFTLQEVYQFEKELGEKHPGNKNIEAKIRQQLQLLRDKGYIAFLERGIYQKI